MIYIFQLPKQTNIVIFDKIEHDMILDTVIPEKYSSQLLDSKITNVYLNPIFLVIYMVTAMQYIFTSRNIKSTLYKVYILSVLKLMRPKIIVTFSDNNLIYHWLVKKYKKARFIAIQNGVRAPYQFKTMKSSTDISINHDIFYCFGEYDIRKHNEMGFRMDNPIPIGSLRLSNFNALKRSIKTEYDICLVSKYGKKNPSKSPLIDEFIHNSKSLDLDIAKLAENKKLKVIIALRTKSEKEKDYYYSIFKDNAKYAFNEDSESSYRACLASELIISYQSSMLIEMLAVEKKVLHVDYTNNKDIFDYKGFIRLDYIDYFNFEHHVINILSIDYEIYKKILKDDQKDFMNQDHENPPNIVIKKHIDLLMSIANV